MVELVLQRKRIVTPEGVIAAASSAARTTGAHGVPAWKGKAALREAGLTGTVEAAVAAAGERVQDAWAGASDWSRDSGIILLPATELGLTKQQIDDMFRAADAMRG